MVLLDKFYILGVFIIFFSCSERRHTNTIKKSDDFIIDVVYYKNSNNLVKELRVRDCAGDLPDSLDISKLQFLQMEGSDLNIDLNITKATLEHLDVWYSNLGDTFAIRGFDKLRSLYIVNTKTKFIIDDKLSINLLSIDTKHEEFAVLPNVDLDKLSSLDSLIVTCRDCEIYPPNKKLSFINFKTNVADTTSP